MLPGLSSQQWILYNNLSEDNKPQFLEMIADMNAEVKANVKVAEEKARKEERDKSVCSFKKIILLSLRIFTKPQSALSSFVSKRLRLGFSTNFVVICKLEIIRFII